MRVVTASTIPTAVTYSRALAGWAATNLPAWIHEARRRRNFSNVGSGDVDPRESGARRGLTVSVVDREADAFERLDAHQAHPDAGIPVLRLPDSTRVADRLAVPPA